MKINKIFCRKHYRRSVEYVPIMIPVTLDYKIGKTLIKRKDVEYKLMCPVCWELKKSKDHS